MTYRKHESATLTADLLHTLDVYKDLYRQHRRPPTLSEVAASLGITPQAVSLRAQRLAKAGLLKKVVPAAVAFRGAYAPTGREP